MKGIVVDRKAIRFERGSRGTNVFWYDLLHWGTRRGRRFFFHQLLSGIKLLLFKEANQ